MPKAIKCPIEIGELVNVTGKRVGHVSEPDTPPKKS